MSRPPRVSTESIEPNKCSERHRVRRSPSSIVERKAEADADNKMADSVQLIAARATDVHALRLATQNSSSVSSRPRRPLPFRLLNPIVEGANSGEYK